jgi:predicted outer membrane protein
MRTHLLLCIALVAGCSDDNNNNNGDNGDAPEAQALAQGDTHGQVLVGQARGEFSGAPDTDAIAKVADIVATIDAGEIAQASFVLSTGGDAHVLDLASRIQADHQANQAMLQMIIQRRGIAPTDNAVSRTLQAEGDMSLAQLQSTAPADLDTAYVEMQIQMHQEASVLIDNLRSYVKVFEVDDFLSNTLDTIALHLQRAIDLLRDRT